MKQLPGKLEVRKENFLEMRVEATGLKGLGLEGPFSGWERVYFKPLRAIGAEEQLFLAFVGSVSGNL